MGLLRVAKYHREQNENYQASPMRRISIENPNRENKIFATLSAPNIL